MLQMYVHPIKKMLGLFVLYSVVIIGIFVLQFKSEAVLSKTIGPLRYTLITTTRDKKVTIKDSVQVSFKNLAFLIDKDNPVSIRKSGQTADEHLSPISYSENGPFSVTFDYTEGASLTFSVSDKSDKASFSIYANIPDGVDSISVPFSPPADSQVSLQQDASVIIKTANKTFLMKANNVSNNFVTLSADSPSLLYYEVAKQKESVFDKVRNLDVANKDVYFQNLKKLSATIIDDFRATIQRNNQPTEQSIMAFVSIMAQDGKYKEAIDFVPLSFKQGQRRTYLTSPYFGSLSLMAHSLSMQMDNYKKLLQGGVAARSCDIFTQNGIAMYIILNSTDPDILTLLDLPTTLEGKFTVMQSAGIIGVYTEIAKEDKNIASHLESALDDCMIIIENSCTVDGDKVVILGENNEKMLPLQALKTGDALIQYGTFANDSDIVNCGYALVNSYLQDLSQYDQRTLSEAYPLVVHSAWYPHFQAIYTGGKEPIWAWTCASKISYTIEENDIVFNVEFPEGLSHFLILNGIQPFKRIQIYNIDYRTDPRFEMYNSSGYIYISAQHTLLLKILHKESYEPIRISFDHTLSQP